MGYDYDIIVIGSGPAGQNAAVQAAKLGRRVAVVECNRELGGVCVNTGTIPSKTIREAVLYLTGLNQRAVYGQSYRLKDEITVRDLRERTRFVVERERDALRDRLLRSHVAIVEGRARFLDLQTIAVAGHDADEERLAAEKVVVATGSRPAHPPGIDFAHPMIFDSDEILRMARIPESVVVVGAGVIGIEYASMAAALGVAVTVVDLRADMLDFCDAEIVESLRYHLRELGVVFRFGERVTEVSAREEGTLTKLASGKQIAADAVFYSAGREGATDGLGLENAGLAADERGRIGVGERYRTAVPGVYAVGDVIGFPSLAATSAEQGRIAACDACGVEPEAAAGLLPFGIYSIPEISYVGKTEAELTEAAIPYEVGAAHYKDVARGQILGDTAGMVKLLVSPADRTLLGVHALGAGATELVHIGQAVMGLGGTVDYLVSTVFNYPTLAEAYKLAALDAADKLRELSRVSG